MTTKAGQSALTEFIRIENVQKEYVSGRRIIHALRGIDLSIGRGEWVTLLGPSGCGKSTLLNLLSGIDRPTSGRVVINGTEISSRTEEQLSQWRGRNIGIIFQFFQLMPTLTALENVVLPMDLAGLGRDRARARELLERVGLGALASHLPSELSGGEQQRVAIARSLVLQPEVLLLDEPTSALDPRSADLIIQLLIGLSESLEITVIMVSHTLEQAAKFATSVLAVRDGEVRLFDNVEDAARWSMPVGVEEEVPTSDA
jgi:putative ABC transport system ATP-binding protein